VLETSNGLRCSVDFQSTFTSEEKLSLSVVKSLIVESCSYWSNWNISIKACKLPANEQV